MGTEGEEVSIYAKIKNGNEVIKEMLVQDMATVVDWLARHFGEYDAYEIKYRKAEDIRQGREP